MSDGDPANRLRGLMLATPEATPYQVYLADAYEALADSRKEIEYEIERRVAGEERASDLDIYYQAIAEVYGATVDRAEELLHGRTSLVEHGGDGVLAGLPNPFTATRYHSLAVVDGTVPAALEVTARTGGGVIMGLRHREHAVEGVQFHPESVLTQGGHRMLANWLAECGDRTAADLVAPLEQDVERLRLSAV